MKKATAKAVSTAAITAMVTLDTFYSVRREESSLFQQIHTGQLHERDSEAVDGTFAGTQSVGGMIQRPLEA